MCFTRHETNTYTYVLCFSRMAGGPLLGQEVSITYEHQQSVHSLLAVLLGRGRLLLLRPVDDAPLRQRRCATTASTRGESLRHGPVRHARNAGALLKVSAAVRRPRAAAPAVGSAAAAPDGRAGGAELSTQRVLRTAVARGAAHGCPAVLRLCPRHGCSRKAPQRSSRTPRYAS